MLPPEILDMRAEKAPGLSPNAQQEIEATVVWKYRQYDWGLLQGFWQRAQGSFDGLAFFRNLPLRSEVLTQ